METDDRLFDGAISACGVMAGTPLFFDRSLAFAVAYDAAFGWPTEWGTPGDVRDDLDFERDVLPLFLPHLFNPTDFGGLEFIRLASGIPIEGFYDGPSLLFAHVFFTTEARAQLETKFGGPGTQNLDHTYRLSADHTAYLAGFGVEAGPLLDAMNAHTIYRAKRSVRRYMEKYASFDGRIRKPLLSMHAILDGLATADNESVYRSINREAGREEQLLQVFTGGIGHCTFTNEQYLSAIQAMEAWLDTGEKPHHGFFPDSQGFVRPFSPPHWPQPIR